jgi:hypothetical protein
MEPLPDFATLSDEDLKELIDRLMAEENEVSYRRRVLHGRIDILRAERAARLQRKVGEGKSPLEDVDVARLSEILAGKAMPPDSGGSTGSQ